MYTSLISTTCCTTKNIEIYTIVVIWEVYIIYLVTYMLLNRHYTNNIYTQSTKTPPPLISLFIILQYNKLMTHLDYQCSQNG